VATEVEDAEALPVVMTVDIMAPGLTEAISVEIWVIRIHGLPEIRAEADTVVAIEGHSTKQNKSERKDLTLNDAIFESCATPIL